MSDALGDGPSPLVSPSRPLELGQVNGQLFDASSSAFELPDDLRKLMLHGITGSIASQLRSHQKMRTLMYFFGFFLRSVVNESMRCTRLRMS